jgi:hypothetical protein
MLYGAARYLFIPKHPRANYRCKYDGGGENQSVVWVFHMSAVCSAGLSNIEQPCSKGERFAGWRVTGSCRET